MCDHYLLYVVYVSQLVGAEGPIIGSQHIHRAHSCMACTVCIIILNITGQHCITVYMYTVHVGPIFRGNYMSQMRAKRLFAGLNFVDHRL